MQNNFTRPISPPTEKVGETPRRAVIQDGKLIITEDFTQYDGVSAASFSTKQASLTGDNLNPVPRRGFDDGVTGSDNLRKQFDAKIPELVTV